MCGSDSAFWRLAATMEARLALIEGELLFLAAQITGSHPLGRINSGPTFAPRSDQKPPKIFCRSFII